MSVEFDEDILSHPTRHLQSVVDGGKSPTPGLVSFFIKIRLVQSVQQGTKLLYFILVFSLIGIVVSTYYFFGFSFLHFNTTSIGPNKDDPRIPANVRELFTPPSQRNK